jgi:hypothetical protein
MKVNAGYNRKRERGYEHKNVQGIKVEEGLTAKQTATELMKHKPDGEGWRLTGWAEVNNDNADTRSRERR